MIKKSHKMGAPVCALHRESKTVIVCNSGRLNASAIPNILNVIIAQGWEITDIEWGDSDDIRETVTDFADLDTIDELEKILGWKRIQLDEVSGVTQIFNK